MNAFFDFERFDAIDEDGFRDQKPFPFLNPAGLLRPGAWEQLESELPNIERFDKKFGKKRYGGQIPHDRYSLEYTDDAEISPAWQTFISELRSDRYRDKVSRLLGARSVQLRFHWHYTPTGCGVSPHIDQHRELGSHIFYFNSPGWSSQWGGQTLILGSNRHIERKAAPQLEDFEQHIEAECIGNRSLLFAGRNQGWHAVRPIECEPDQMRCVFIVVCNTTNFYWRVRDWVIGKQVQQY